MLPKGFCWFLSKEEQNTVVRILIHARSSGKTIPFPPGKAWPDGSHAWSLELTAIHTQLFSFLNASSVTSPNVNLAQESYVIPGSTICYMEDPVCVYWAGGWRGCLVIFRASNRVLRWHCFSGREKLTLEWNCCGLAWGLFLIFYVFCLFNIYLFTYLYVMLCYVTLC